MSAPSSAEQRVAVWDVPVRLFHWALAGLLVFSYLTAKIGGGWLEWHMRSGYAILALLLFRLAWAAFGSHTARFTAFVRGPRAANDYLKALLARRPPRLPGHNPLGGWMVLFMLLVLLLQTITGLFVDDEISTQGPLAAKVSNALVARFTTIHRYNEWVIVGMVALHLVAVAAYQWTLRIDLIGPMLHGHMRMDEPMPPPRSASSLLALVLFGVACAGVYWLVVVFPRAPA